MSIKNIYLINAAGANTSAIEIIKKPLNKNDYVNRGKKILDNYKKVDQVGFLDITKNKLEMSGGEFCVNAARSAAVVLFEIKNINKFEFIMSGFKNKIQANVEKNSNKTYEVTCKFPNLKIKSKNVSVMNKKAVLVDLGGIVHIIIDSDFPKNNYKTIHQKIMRELNIYSRKAVGVCWINSINKKTIINPVVWVRDVDSLFYEKSCGSASIATAKVVNKKNITQATGQAINVFFESKYTYVNSKMKIIK